MAKVTINQDRCKSCFLCIEFCPKKAIHIGEKLNRYGVRPVKFDENAGCLGCAICAVICPDCCIEVS